MSYTTCFDQVFYQSPFIMPLYGTVLGLRAQTQLEKYQKYRKRFLFPFSPQQGSFLHVKQLHRIIKFDWFMLHSLLFSIRWVTDARSMLSSTKYSIHSNIICHNSPGIHHTVPNVKTTESKYLQSWDGLLSFSRVCLFDGCYIKHNSIPNIKIVNTTKFKNIFVCIEQKSCQQHEQKWY